MAQDDTAFQHKPHCIPVGGSYQTQHPSVLTSTAPITNNAGLKFAHGTPLTPRSVQKAFSVPSYHCNFLYQKGALP